MNFDLFQGELHLKPELSIVCKLYQNYQHYFETYTRIFCNLSTRLKSDIEIITGQAVLELLSKRYFACFDQKLKNCLAWKNLNEILSFSAGHITL